jgi:hypothetical protein
MSQEKHRKSSRWSFPVAKIVVKNCTEYVKFVVRISKIYKTFC